MESHAKGDDLKQHTRVIRWDLADADLNDGKIVCQQGADILLYDKEKWWMQD